MNSDGSMQSVISYIKGFYEKAHKRPQCLHQEKKRKNNEYRFKHKYRTKYNYKTDLY